MKAKRQEIILEIIANQAIETQNQLQEALENRGIGTTQATLSRDIKELNLSKKTNANGKSVYVTDINNVDNTKSLRSLIRILRECVKSYDVAQNFIVIKTLPGLASAACSALDQMEIEKLVGTIAGDDTAFLLFKDNLSAEYFLKEIDTLI